jgi:hypothetical protein
MTLLVSKILMDLTDLIVNPLLTVTRSEIACVRVVGKCGVL